MSDFDRESMLETFLYESNQLVEQLETYIIQSDTDYTTEMINEIFRIMHTIKGSAAMMLFESISVTAHEIEDLFFYLRENKPQNVNYTAITDIVLSFADYIKDELARIAAGGFSNEVPAQLIKDIKSLLADLKGAGGDIAAPADIPADTGLDRYHAVIFFEEGSEMENVRAYTVIRNIEEVSENIVHQPSDIIADEAIEDIRQNGFEISFDSSLTYEEIYEILMKSFYIQELRLESLSHRTEQKEKQGNICREFLAKIKFEDGCEMENVRAFALVHHLEKYAHNIETEPENLMDPDVSPIIGQKGLKVSFTTDLAYEEIYKILSATIYLKDLEVVELSTHMETPDESFMLDYAAQKETATGGATKESNSQGQGFQQLKKYSSQHAISVSVQKLDLLLNLVGELVISEAMVTQNPELEGLELDSFTKEARQLHKIINDVQDTVMSMRMVPLSSTFFKMHRIVRDMCKQLGKSVQLEIIGEDTEVDKNIIEHISDPLMHIIRNSVDHGIEMPETRMLAGKPEKGTITLEAKNSGGDVLISVKDDGAGFDGEKILAKARAQGMLTKPEEEYTEKEIYQFVLLPGFSTNDKVTEYSGRGVGMDVVVNNIEHVGGTVLVDSVPGEGSSFVLKIPLTLAIIEGMIIRIGDVKYTIPINSIINFLKAEDKDIILDPSGNEMLMVREECYNFVRLNRVFELEDGIETIEDGIVTMLENEGETIAVLVDELLGEQQVVVKNIPKYIKKVRGIGGCTLLGNGDISLIIDVAGLFDR